jgi:transposase
MRTGIKVEVSSTDRSELDAIVADRNSPQKHVWRAKIVLLTADGCGTAEIMRRAGTSKTAVWRWQERFMTDRVAGLLGRDRPRGLDAQDAASAAARLPCDQPRAYSRA